VFFATGMDACKALKYWRDRRKRWCWAPAACAPPCRSWTSSPPRKRTTWSKSWTTGPSAPSTTSPPPYRRPARPCRRTCIRPPPGRTSTGESRLHIIPLCLSNDVHNFIPNGVVIYFHRQKLFVTPPLRERERERVRGRESVCEGVVIVIKWASVLERRTHALCLPLCAV